MDYRWTLRVKAFEPFRDASNLGEKSIVSGTKVKDDNRRHHATHNV